MGAGHEREVGVLARVPGGEEFGPDGGVAVVDAGRVLREPGAGDRSGLEAVVRRGRRTEPRPAARPRRWTRRDLRPRGARTRRVALPARGRSRRSSPAPGSARRPARRRPTPGIAEADGTGLPATKLAALVSRSCSCWRASRSVVATLTAAAVCTAAEFCASRVARLWAPRMPANPPTRTTIAPTPTHAARCRGVDRTPTLTCRGRRRGLSAAQQSERAPGRRRPRRHRIGYPGRRPTWRGPTSRDGTPRRPRDHGVGDGDHPGTHQDGLAVQSVRLPGPVQVLVVLEDHGLDRPGEPDPVDDGGADVGVGRCRIERGRPVVGVDHAGVADDADVVEGRRQADSPGLVLGSPSRLAMRTARSATARWWSAIDGS